MVAAGRLETAEGTESTHVKFSKGENSFFSKEEVLIKRIIVIALKHIKFAIFVPYFLK